MMTPFGPVTLQCPAGTLYPARYDSINGLWRPIDGTTGEWVSECPCSGCSALRAAGWPDPHAQRVDHPPLGTTLPDPWPKMMIEYATSTLGWARGTVAYAYADPDDPTYVLLETDDPNDPDDGIEWCAENIREVRTPDGVTLWKRPAANGGAR